MEQGKVAWGMVAAVDYNARLLLDESIAVRKNKWEIIVANC